MSETRRQLFKTSVMSAIGLAAGAGLTRCESDNGGQAPFIVSPSTDVPILGVADSSTDWFVFIYDGSQYYITYGPTPPPFFVSANNKKVYIDTVAWFNNLGSSDRPLAGKIEKYFNGHLVQTNLHSQVIFPDSGTLANLGANQHDFTWNEIGRP
jgi:hypothetical protein